MLILQPNSMVSRETLTDLPSLARLLASQDLPWATTALRVPAASGAVNNPPRTNGTKLPRDRTSTTALADISHRRDDADPELLGGQDVVRRSEDRPKRRRVQTVLSLEISTHSAGLPV
jgi:hypothetical protein